MYRLMAALMLFVACGPIEENQSQKESGRTVVDAVQAQCPDPSDPNVEYVGQDRSQCAASLFRCEAGQTTFDDACGCGCVGPKATATPACPNPSAPGVHYIGSSVSKCAAVFFQCTATQKTFNDSCGCGCID